MPGRPKKAKKLKGWDEPPMVDVPENPPVRRRKKPINQALWTENKALLIERYLYYFVMVTKSGTYIDGFAGPQYPDIPKTWAAQMVLESEPAWLDHFHLFELEKPGLAHLGALKAAHPDRDVQIYPGDFNVLVDRILQPQVIRQTEPTFCLIDQHTFECSWATVKRIAAYKAPRRIELFYFLANSWLGRAVAATTTKNGRVLIEEWWDGPGWKRLRGLRPYERAQAVTERFTEELGYEWSFPYAIYRYERKTPIAYWMIHATDHPAAPELMDRAYAKAVEPTHEPLDQVSIEEILRR